MGCRYIPLQKFSHIFSLGVAPSIDRPLGLQQYGANYKDPVQSGRIPAVKGTRWSIIGLGLKDTRWNRFGPGLKFIRLISLTKEYVMGSY